MSYPENRTISEIMAIIPFKSIKHISPGMLPESGIKNTI